MFENLLLGYLDRLDPALSPETVNALAGYASSYAMFADAIGSLLASLLVCAAIAREARR
jgi:hypothetical protein